MLPMTQLKNSKIDSSKESFQIRIATPDDAQAIVEYLASIFTDPMAAIADGDEINLDPWAEREFLKRISANPSAIALVAIHENSIIGFLTCEASRKRKISHVADIGMSVRSDWRNLGVGSAMLEFAENWARSTGKIRKLTLNVFEHNQAARKLYEKMGFVYEGCLTDQIALDGSFQDLLLMAKHLK